jgi:hypothetical protein
VGTARRLRARVFAIFQSHLNYVTFVTQRRCAMWRMGTSGSLIFIAAVVVMVALALLA